MTRFPSPGLVHDVPLVAFQLYTEAYAFCFRMLGLGPSKQEHFH